MSLNSTLNTALTGLQVNQNLMRLVSTNIANAGTEGYTRKTAALSAIELNDIGSGVQIESINRTVDNYLVKQINLQTSTVSRNDVLNDFYTRLQDMFGSPSDNTSISGLMNSLRTALEQLAADPQQSVNQYTVITAAQGVVNNFKDLSDTIQSFREEVDKQIGIGVDTLNNALVQLDELNNSIVRNNTMGQSVGDLLDKRDKLLQDMAEQIDIKWFEREGGSVYIMTGDNYTLLDNDPHQITFTSPTGVSKSTVYPGGFSEIAVADVSPDITTTINDGKLKALIDLRDTLLPGLQDQIDQLATTFANEINRAHNSAMSVPAPTEFTGTTEFTTSDLLDVSNPESIALTAYTDTTTSVTSYGSIQFAIIDATGNGVGQALRVNLDEFKSEMEAYVSGYTGSPFDYQLTVGDIINMINGAYAATPPTGTAIPPTPSGWPGGVPWPPSPALIMPSSGSDIAGLTNMSAASVEGAFTGGEFARMSNGHLELAIDPDSGYGLAIDDTNSTFTQSGSTQSATFNYLMKLNNLLELESNNVSAADGITVRADIAADPSLLGRAYLSSVERTPGDPTTEEWYIGRGDGSAATAMSNVFDSQHVFSAEGGLPASNQRLTEYAASIIQMNARGAQDAADGLEFSNNLKTELESRWGSVSGVNIDEELAYLITVQNAYSASARVVTTVNDMFDDLLGLIR
jgi:flagellar hook-associated protein 1 FlgK